MKDISINEIKLILNNFYNRPEGKEIYIYNSKIRDLVEKKIISFQKKDSDFKLQNCFFKDLKEIDLKNEIHNYSGHQSPCYSYRIKLAKIEETIASNEISISIMFSMIAPFYSIFYENIVQLDYFKSNSFERAKNFSFPVLSSETIINDINFDIEKLKILVENRFQEFRFLAMELLFNNFIIGCPYGWDAENPTNLPLYNYLFDLEYAYYKIRLIN